MCETAGNWDLSLTLGEGNAGPNLFTVRSW